MNTPTHSNHVYSLRAFLFSVFVAACGAFGQEEAIQAPADELAELDWPAPENTPAAVLERAEAIRSLLAEGATEFALSRARELVEENPAEPVAHQVRANALLVSNRLPEALEAMKTASELNPRDVRLLSQLGGLQILSGEREAARSSFERALEIEPTYSAARRGLAALAEQEGRIDEAIRLYELILEEGGEKPTSSSVVNELARLYNSASRFDDAIELLDVRMKGERPDVESRVVATTAYIGADRLDDAAKEIEHALAGDRLPDPLLLWAGTAFRESRRFDESLLALSFVTANAAYDAMIQAGETLAAMGRVGEAIARFEEALKLDDVSWAPRQRIVELALASGDPAKAREISREIMESDSAPLASLDALGAAYEGEELYQEALAVYRRANARFPQEALPLYRLAILNLAMGFPERTVEQLKAMLAIKPEHAAALQLLGSAYQQIGDWENALEAARKLVEVNPGNVEGQLLVAGLLDYLGRKEEAILAYRETLALDSENVAALNNLALLLSSKGESEEAVELARKAVELTSEGSSGVLDTLGTTLFDAGNYSESVAALERSVALDGNDPAALYHLGLSYEKVGRIDEARSALNKAVDHPTDFPEREEAIKSLEELGK